jgi:ABC-type Mn2+/Zn2+ transport system ATPase subunit
MATINEDKKSIRLSKSLNKGVKDTTKVSKETTKVSKETTKGVFSTTKTIFNVFKSYLNTYMSMNVSSEESNNRLLDKKNTTVDIRNIQNTPFGLLKLGFSLMDNPFKYILMVLFIELLEIIPVLGLMYQNIFLVSFFPIVICVTNMYMTKSNMLLNTRTVKKWERVVYDFFQTLSYNDRKKYENMEDFQSQVGKTGWAIARVITWGFNLSIGICITILNCIMIIIQKGYYIMLLIVPSLFYLYIRLRMKQKQEQLTQVRKRKKELEKQIKPISHWYLHLFQNIKRSSEETLDIENQLKDIDDDFWIIWESIASEIIITGKILSFICIISQVKTFEQMLVIKVMFDSLMSTITSMGHLTNGLANNIKDFDRFITWANEVKTETDIVEQEKLIFPVEISGVNIVFDNFSLRTKNELTICSADKILLRGISGAGKTQLVNALQGLISGCLYKSFNSKATKGWWEYMNQQTREAIPSGGISLRKMLENEQNDDFICHLINIVKLNHIFNKENIDEPMKGLSGGEIMRLSLLYTLWNLEDKEILILDEPEQGLDEDTRVEVINNIFIHVKKPILIIYHGSRLDLLQLPLTKAWVFSRNVDRSSVEQLSWNEFRPVIVDEIKKIINM